MFDKYSCETHPLTDFDQAPVFVLTYNNSDTNIEYFFIPIVRLLEDQQVVTDVKISTGDIPLIRGREAWMWSARIKVKFFIDIFEKD